jgi:PilZ domain
MLTHDEKRNYTRMHIDCNIHYKLAGSNVVHKGHCTSISGSGISFTTDSPISQGKAIEINVVPNNSITPPMIAFIEVVRITRQANDNYEIAATIKSIKGC